MNKAEQELIIKATNGDYEAFEILIKIFENKIYTTAYYIIGNKAKALDIARRVFIKAYKSLFKGLKDKRSFATLLYKFTVNDCLELNEQWLDKEEIPKDNRHKSLHKSNIRNAIKSLPQEQRMIIVLHDLQQLSYDEISEIIDCSVGTVNLKLHRARVALRQIVAPLREEYSTTQRSPLWQESR